MRPLVSVVLPVWNGLSTGRGYLEQSVFSLVDQDYDGPIEIIAVDDGSSDGTANQLSVWSDTIQQNRKSRVLRVFAVKHEGVTKALNHGLRQVTGSFVARQDADDWSSLCRISKQVDYLNAHQEVVLLGSAVHVVHDSQVKQEVWYKASGLVTKKDFSERSPLAHGSVLFRREVLDTVGMYNEQYPHAQDYDFFWRVCKQYTVATLADPLYYYRVHKNRITSSPDRFRIQLSCFRQIRSRIQSELQQ